jgi:hypothetical protein
MCGRCKGFATRRSVWTCSPAKTFTGTGAVGVESLGRSLTCDRQLDVVAHPVAFSAQVGQVVRRNRGIRPDPPQQAQPEPTQVLVLAGIVGDQT